MTTIVAAFLVLLGLERLFPGTKLPRVPFWKRRVALANVAQAGILVLAALTWDRWLRGASLLHLGERASPLAGAVVAYLGSTFVWYWWHRARHEVPWLWRGMHQLHHSPRRIELITSFYKHPLEQLSNALLGAVIAYPILGLSPAGTALYTGFAALAELVYHANLRTPRWLGFFVQRPEMHRIHHQRGRHRDNYGDLPIWDMLFGTYRNPAEADVACGFDEDGEAKVGAMLAFEDVSRREGTS
jgi:sterol desaturase/sphingolipid hydroxylase (fatty acid hydroxylase superfamily)